MKPTTAKSNAIAAAITGKTASENTSATGGDTSASSAGESSQASTAGPEGTSSSGEPPPQSQTSALPESTAGESTAGSFGPFSKHDMLPEMTAAETKTEMPSSSVSVLESSIASVQEGVTSAHGPLAQSSQPSSVEADSILHPRSEKPAERLERLLKDDPWALLLDSEREEMESGIAQERYGGEKGPVELIADKMGAICDEEIATLTLIGQLTGHETDDRLRAQIAKWETLRGKIVPQMPGSVLVGAFDRAGGGKGKAE